MKIADKIAIMQTTFGYMRKALIFPATEEIDNPGFKFYLIYIVLNVSTTPLILGILLHIAINVIRKTYINLGVDIAVSLSLIGCYMYNIFYLVHIKNTLNIYRMLSDFETYGMPDTFEATNNKMNKVSQLHTVVIVVLITGLALSPGLEYHQCQKHYDGIDAEEICGVIAGAWLPFGLLNSVNKQIYYGYQVYSAYVLYFTADHINFGMLETVEHIIARFHHVKTTFLEVLREKDYYLRRKKFGRAVDYHIAVINLVTMLNKTFSSCMFVHVFLSAPLLGCVGHGLLESYSVSPICLFLGWVISLLTSCSSGQRLTNEGESIGDDVYSSDWPDVDLQIQKELVIVLRKCQMPIVLQGRPLATMNFPMILSILNASYSYLALLSQTK